MIESVVIEQEMQQQFHQLAQETHRSEAEIIHEALAGYLAADQRYVEVLKQRIAAADRGEFASEKKSRHSLPSAASNGSKGATSQSFSAAPSAFQCGNSRTDLKNTSRARSAHNTSFSFPLRAAE